MSKRANQNRAEAVLANCVIRKVLVNEVFLNKRRPKLTKIKVCGVTLTVRELRTYSGALA